MNSWYDPDDWYAPLRADVADPGEEEKKRRQRRIRTFGALVILAALIFATGLSLSNLIRKTSEIRVAAQPENEELPEEYPDDYQDFFSRYYTPVETKTSIVSIPRSEEKLSFTLKLERRREAELTLQELYSSCSPSIVAIAGYQKGIVGYNWGTGVVLSEDGLILTNTHVIDQCDRAEVIFDDDVTYAASLIGADSTSDIALLKIDASGLPAASFGGARDLQDDDPGARVGLFVRPAHEPRRDARVPSPRQD